VGIKRISVIFIAACLLACVTLFPYTFLPQDGDMNADGRVDIIDAQAMVAQAVGNMSLARDADLDEEHCTMAQASGNPFRKNPPPRRSKPPKGVQTRIERNNLRAHQAVVAVLAEDANYRVVDAHETCVQVHVSPAVDERYMFTLTSHAPPVFS
jgi:hypothetical protein